MPSSIAFPSTVESNWKSTKCQMNARITSVCVEFLREDNPSSFQHFVGVLGLPIFGSELADVRGIVNADVGPHADVDLCLADPVQDGLCRLGAEFLCNDCAVFQSEVLSLQNSLNMQVARSRSSMGRFRVVP